MHCLMKKKHNTIYNACMYIYVYIYTHIHYNKLGS